jgi:hypothetical protein
LAETLVRENASVIVAQGLRQAYLAEQAHQNPAAFLTLLGRVLPREPIETPPAVITLDFGFRPPRALPRSDTAPRVVNSSAVTRPILLPPGADDKLSLRSDRNDDRE